MRLGLLAASAAFVALLWPAASAAGPGLLVGAVEDDVRASSLVEAETRMALMRLSGFRAVRITSYWQPGDTRPSEDELRVLENFAAAAARNAIRPYLTVMHPGSRTTPLTDEAQAQFAAYAAAIVRQVPAIRDVIVANEPNLNRFWLPQFGLDGSSAAPAAYLALLARTYDALKAAAPELNVYGGAVSPRGTDRPQGIRPTHSPTTFIQGLGVAYRASGRSRPVMDAFAIHVYADNSSIPPTRGNPRTTRSASPTTTSSSVSWARPSTGPRSPAPRFRSCTASTASKHRFRRARRACTPDPSRRPRGPYRRRRRAITTARRCRLPTASPT